MFQTGVAPRRIDILTDLTGLSFEDAWRTRIRRAFGDVEVDFIGRGALTEHWQRLEDIRKGSQGAQNAEGDEAGLKPCATRRA